MKTQFCFIIISIFAFISCAPEMYVPNMQNIPAFKKKGEVVLNASISDLGNEFQAAYAVSDKVGILLNGTYIEDRYESDELYNVYGLGKAIELGAGYFKNKNNFVFENYGLLGFAKIKNGQGTVGSQLLGPKGNLETNLFRIANQTSLTYSRKIFEVSLSSRLSYLHYYGISTSPYVFNDVDMNQYLKSSPNFLFIEPAATFRLGIKNVKLQLQLQRSFSLKSIPSTNHYQYFDAIGYFGLFVKI